MSEVKSKTGNGSDKSIEKAIEKEVYFGTYPVLPKER